MINLQPLVTPAVAIAFLGGLWKILDGYLNHHATQNADKISEKIDTQTQTLVNKIDEGNNKVVTAILSLKQ